MHIALYSRQTDDNGMDFIRSVLFFLKEKNNVLSVYKPLYDMLDDKTKSLLDSTFQNSHDLKTQSTDFLFSIGGDGTFIDAANLVGDSQIPILGINTGRIGFLTNVNRKNFPQAFDFLQNGDYQTENRMVLRVETDNGTDIGTHFALNDISIHPSGESINEIKVWANDEKVNTYWGDGLIVATPTGSTAYSLSCGGPILVPSADVIVLTPIASHSLTVRPIVLPADNTLKIKVESRTRKFILSIDSHRVVVNDSATLTLTRAGYTIPTVRLPNADFYSVIQEKLLWGLDKRNGES